MNREEQQLLERQNRVYGVLDVATKPAQWFLGGLQLLLFGLVLAGMAIGTPIYYFCTGGTVTLAMLTTAGLSLAAVILFFLSPWYFVFGGIVYWMGLGFWGESHDPDHIIIHSLMPPVVVFLALGYAIVIVRKVGERAAKRRAEQDGQSKTNQLVSYD